MSFSDSQTFNTFHFFPKLPPELRSQIYYQALAVPRIVKLGVITDGSRSVITSSPGQALRCVCHESREIALQTHPRSLYVRRSSNSNAQYKDPGYEGLPFNFAQDTLYLSSKEEKTRDKWWHLAQGGELLDLHRLSYIVDGWQVESVCLEMPLNGRTWNWDLLDMFANVKVVLFVLPQGVPIVTEQEEEDGDNFCREVWHERFHGIEGLRTWEIVKGTNPYLPHVCINLPYQDLLYLSKVEPTDDETEEKHMERKRNERKFLVVSWQNAREVGLVN